MEEGEQSSQTDFSFLGDYFMLCGNSVANNSRQSSNECNDENGEPSDIKSCARCAELTQECLSLTGKVPMYTRVNLHVNYRKILLNFMYQKYTPSAQIATSVLSSHQFPTFAKAFSTNRAYLLIKA